MKKYTVLNALGVPVQYLEFSQEPVVEYLGLPTGHTLQEGTVPLAALPPEETTRLQLQGVQREAEVKEEQGFAYQGHRFSASLEGQTRLHTVVIRALIAAHRKEEFSEDWTMQDGTSVTFTLEQWLDIGTAMATYVSQNYKWARDERKKIVPSPGPSP